MITNARLAAYLDYATWNLTSSAGGTIRSALDFAMAQSPGSESASELYPDVAAVAAEYGDPNGTYVAFLLRHAGDAYVQDPAFLWNQPLSDSGLVGLAPSAAATGSPSGSSASIAKPSATSTGKTGSEATPQDSGAGSWRSKGVLEVLASCVLAASSLVYYL